MTAIGENSGEVRSVDHGSIGSQMMNGRVVEESVFFDSVATRDQELIDAYVVPNVANGGSDGLFLLICPDLKDDELRRLQDKVGSYRGRLWRQYSGESEPTESGQEADLNLTMYKRDIMALLLDYHAVSTDSLAEAYELTEETVDLEILKMAFQDVKKFVNNGCRHVSMGVLATAKV